MVTLDPILHQPLRTQIAAFLAGAGEASFSELKRRLEVSDGNLESHMKKLLAADYVEVRREESGRRPQSFYRLTAAGHQALSAYVTALQAVLGQAVTEPETRPSGIAPYALG